MSTRLHPGSPWSLADFRGDFVQLSDLMRASWSENETRTLLYTPEILESLFQYPGASYALAPAIYEGSSLVAFVAGFPRTLRHRASDLRLLVISLLTVAPPFKNRGFGIALWTEMVARARAAGFDGMVNYCVDGGAMNGMIAGACQRLKLPVARTYSASYLARILFPKASAEPSGGCEPRLTDFLEMAAPLADRAMLGRVWSRDEAEWQCTRAGAVVVCHHSASRRGLLTGYIMPAADANGTKTLLIEDVLWGSLESAERVALVEGLAGQAAARGARVAVVPVLGYAETAPFHQARFRQSRRVVHAYVTLWGADIPLGPVQSFYLDVF